MTMKRRRGMPRPRSMDRLRSDKPGEFTIIFDTPSVKKDRLFGRHTNPSRLRREVGEIMRLEGVRISNVRVVKGIRVPK